MQIDNAAGILAGTDFFSICTDEERRLLAFASERKRYPAGTIITRPGDVPVGAQVLVAGAVSVTPDGGEHPRVVSQAGAVLDLMSLMLERPRHVTITAISNVETLVVPRSAFMKLAADSPTLAQGAADRIRRDLMGFVSTVTSTRRKIGRD
ncbi:MAG TPA: cyclic nucleotide-binding domain-containing protein [Devosia sp.]|jgi:CRP-like cAMP-binding protein|nr:cyclic nucleotide-binding domain-containing protein [Devosia sp.]